MAEAAGQSAPDADRIERLAREAVAAMPALFRDHLGGVAILVEEFADEEALADLGIEDAWELSGLYEGRPLTEQSIWESGTMPPRIRLFRQPLLNEWTQEGGDLRALIVHVLVHEVGHHFGYSDEEMEAIDEGDD